MDGDAVSQCNCIGRWFLGGRLHGLVLRGWVGGIMYVFPWLEAFVVTKGRRRASDRLGRKSCVIKSDVGKSRGNIMIVQVYVLALYVLEVEGR